MPVTPVPPTLTGPLGRLPPEDRDALLTLGTRHRHRDGDVLIRQGDPPSTVQVILRGSVRVVRHTLEGRDLLIALGRPGDVMGELAALDGAPRTSTVSAMGDVSSLVIQAGAFRSFLLEHPRAALSLLQTLAGRLRDSNGRAVEAATQVAGVRVARRLLELAASDGVPAADAIEIRTRLTQEELASWVGLSREGVAGVLRDLRDAAVVTTGRRMIRVHDLDALRRAAGLPD
jgi:CRP/FNR family transcriptional regulator, cyclic AMP receptor protein